MSGGSPVVVVGMGLALPGASSPEEFWELLRGDRPVFTEPGDRIDLANLWSADPATPDHTYSRVSGFMTGFRPHPAVSEVHNGPSEYTATWLRHCIAQATEGIAVGAADRHLFAVGLTADGSHHLEQSLVVDQVRRLLGESDGESDSSVGEMLLELYPLALDDPEQVLPYRIARQATADLPIDTEIVVLDTACSSSLYSIDLGVRALRAGDADIALCGGAFALGAQNLVLFSKLRGLSRSGQVRPLDKAADGVLFSDGAAVLALKTHARALADGDPILGFVAGFGGSSDGRGKAIYAPNPAGQRIALRRAWSAADIEPGDIDWVIAHGTGTPTGDRTELSVLAELVGPGRNPWTVSSNKGLVGHTGWAAGAVSAIHALLALRHETIPAQQLFSELPTGLASEVISVPTADLSWPAQQDGARTVAVSAMGFGGTNGHLLLTDVAPQRPTAEPDRPDPIVLTSWAAHLPGEPDRDHILAWLAGGQPSWPAAFDKDQPLPSPVELRLTPSAIAAMDASQLLAVRCADQLAGSWTKDAELAARTGVFVGHTGPTRTAVRHDTRAYLGDLTARAGDRIPDFTDRIARPVLAAIPAATEDSYPGLMPNIIPARIAQRLDLHGPNMSLDAGLDSFVSALATALRYLRDGEIDLAVVIGVSAAAEYVRPPVGATAAEAAIGIVVTRQSIAQAHAMPELAQLAAMRVDGVTTPAARQRVHYGAEGAVELLRTLHNSPGSTVLAPHADSHTAAVQVTVPAATPAPATTKAPVMTAAPAAPAAKSALRDVMRRRSLVLRPMVADPVRPPVPAIPAGSIVVTDDPAAVREFGLPDHCFVISPGTDAELVASLTVSAGRTIEHVRVILTGTATPDEDIMSAVLAVNDLAFAAVKACVRSLQDGGSVAVLVLDGFDGPSPRPAVGLFTGLVRSLEQELPGCLTFALVVDTTGVAQGLAELAEETASHRYLPVAYLRDGIRAELMLDPAPEPSGTGKLGVPADPVVLATGGARGLTARLVRELLTDGPPRRVWLLGTGAAPDLDAPALPPKPQAIRELLARFPGEKLASLNRRYEAAVREAERVATIRELRDRYGTDRVHYRQCDVRDGDAVAEVVGAALAMDGRVDVVVHGAGLVRSTALTRKTIADYRLVRDVKVRGDRNLRTALAARPPALWVGISSVGAFIGMRGEGDYEAGNEYLLLAANAARAAGRDEVALVSGLWVESGMAAGYAVGTPFTTGLAGFTQLTDEQGTEFFRSELAGRGGAGLATTRVGESEWTTLHRTAPGLREACQETPAPLDIPRLAFLTEPPERVGTEAVWRFDIGLDQHPWLLDHLVDDRPTVPATVLLELAAEAAAQLAPGLVPVRMTDIALSRFLRAPRARWPRPVEVVASRTGDVVEVRISTPATPLIPAHEHARMAVVLGTAPVNAEHAGVLRPAGISAPDVYQLGGSVQLSGVFGALRAARLHEDGGSAELHLPPLGEAWADFLLPSITLDAVLRTVVLAGHDQREIPLIVPIGIAEINFGAVGNDGDLVRRWGSDGITLRHWSGRSDNGGRCVAIASDGTVLLSISGISASVRGRYDLDSSGWLAKETVAVS